MFPEATCYAQRLYWSGQAAQQGKGNNVKVIGCSVSVWLCCDLPRHDPVEPRSRSAARMLFTLLLVGAISACMTPGYQGQEGAFTKTDQLIGQRQAAQDVRVFQTVPTGSSPLGGDHFADVTKFLGKPSNEAAFQDDLVRVAFAKRAGRYRQHSNKASEQSVGQLLVCRVNDGFNVQAELTFTKELISSAVHFLYKIYMILVTAKLHQTAIKRRGWEIDIASRCMRNYHHNIFATNFIRPKMEAMIPLKLCGY